MREVRRILEEGLPPEKYEKIILLMANQPR
jgi:hypothetical protein